MTVSSTTTKTSLSGDGTQHSFAYGFKIFADADLEVYIRNSLGAETLQTLNTEYIVTGAGNESGGNVLFKYNTGDSSDAHYSATDYRPASGETVVIKRVLTLTQGTDYVANDPFPAESHEEALDRLTFISQQMQEELDRSIKASVGNTITGAEFTLSAADRANKVFAFDSSGDLSITQELGIYRGTDATTTTSAYNARDLVKSTTAAQLDNVYIALQDSPSGTLLTNTTYWALVVDAVSAATSATNAANDADDAEKLAINPEDSQFTLSDGSTTGYSALHHKEKALDAQTAAETAQTAAEAAQTAAETAQTAAETAQSAAEAALDNFDDRFLGAKATDPTVDNDGNALLDGALYFDTTNDIMKVYDLTNTQWRQLTLTSANQANVNTVAGEISPTNNIATVAGDSADIQSLASYTSEINTVATDIANVNLVGADITNVNTVATNIADVNNFADTYFISATAPASPTTGDLWFDTTNSIMKVYDGSGFVNAGSSVNGTAERSNYVVGTASGSYTGSTTTFPATYDAGYVDVYLNGIKLVVGDDFTATNGSTVVLATAAASGASVDIVAYGTFNVADVGASLSTLGISNHNNLTVDGSGNVSVSGTLGVTGVTTLSNNLDIDGNELILDADGDTSITADTDDQIDFKTGGSDRVTINSTGYVGIGTTSPATATGGGIDIHKAGGASVRLDDTTNTVTGELQVYSSGMNLATTTNHDIIFSPNNSESVRFDKNGNVGIGTTSPSATLEVDAATTNGLVQIGQLQFKNSSGNFTSGTDGIHMFPFSDGNIYHDNYDGGFSWRTGASSTQIFKVTSTGKTTIGNPSYGSGGNTTTLDVRYAGGGVQYGANFLPNADNAQAIGFFNAAGTGIGSIYLTSSGTTYYTTSDYRLKENDVDMTGAIARVKQLQPKRFNFISDADTTVDGFLAHEVQTVVPEAVSGTHNEVDTDGNPVYQQIDQNKLVPLLTGALKEAIAKIEALEARVTELETA